MSEFTSEDVSEYGGSPHILQPDLGDPELPADAAGAGLGHSSSEARAADRKGVRDAAMVVRYAGMKEAHGEVAETVIDEDTGVASFVQYDEETARRELVAGENDR
jgi:hypothetical protein